MLNLNAVNAKKKTLKRYCWLILTMEIEQGNLSNGSTVIVKRISISIAIGDQLFLCAVKSLMGVKHNNIVRFLGYCANAEGKVAMEGGESVIVMVRERLLCFEYLSNGNLKSLLTGMCSDGIVDSFTSLFLCCLLSFLLIF
jgi:hypothetical protein